jgi:phosphate-selective porin
MRYYYRVWNETGVNNNMSTLGTASSTSNVVLLYQLPVRMRIAPSAIEYGGTLQITDGANFPATGAFTVNTKSQDIMNINVGVTSATQYRPYYLYRNGDNTAYVAFSAEL